MDSSWAMAGDGKGDEEDAGNVGGPAPQPWVTAVGAGGGWGS